MSLLLSKSPETPAGEADSKGTQGPRCLSRRVWDWGTSWKDTLVHLVWLWRAALLLALVLGGVYAWIAPEVTSRLIAVGVVLGLVVLLALDLFAAFFNLPLIAFYGMLWCLLSLTSLLDVFFYSRHLGARQNRIAVLVMFANFGVCIALALLWFTLRT